MVEAVKTGCEWGLPTGLQGLVHLLLCVLCVFVRALFSLALGLPSACLSPPLCALCLRVIRFSPSHQEDTNPARDTVCEPLRNCFRTVQYYRETPSPLPDQRVFQLAPEYIPVLWCDSKWKQLESELLILFPL